MRKWMKGLLIAGAACCLAGAGMTAAGAAMGGGYHLREAVRHDGRYDGWNTLGRETVSPAEPSAAQPVPGSEERPLASADTYEEVRKLQIELFGNHVVIRQKENQEAGCVAVGRGDGDGVSYRIRQDGDELKIKLPKEHVRDGGEVMESLVLEFPAGYEFEEIEIENAGGSLEADALAVRSLDVEDEGGETWISGGNVQRLDLECLAGTVTCLAATSENLSVECNAGKVHVLLAGDRERYHYDLECSAGKILLGDREYSGHYEEEHPDHHSGREVEVECRAGTVTVEFQEPAV